MPTPKKAKNAPKTKLTLRFFDEEHYRLVEQASAKAKQSMNAWIVAVTAAKAREELGV